MSSTPTSTSSIQIPYPRTKIIATLGPASWNEETIARMIDAGATAFRLNFSHGSHEDHARTIALIRVAAKRAARPIAILQDLQGPKIRTGPLCDSKKPIPLSVGQRVKVTHTAECSSPGLISTSYVNLVHDVAVGDRVLLDDGHIELVCRERQRDAIMCEVTAGGLLYSNKGINLPGVKVTAAGFTQKDYRDLKFGLEQGVDFVALSFVRHATDVLNLREVMKGMGYEVAIIAKIEKPEALDNLAEILDASEGIMVARGDLGVEIPSERLPVTQKQIISAARNRGRVVITATQMLESMTANPRPTRAETSDVANAIFDGTDAVMLSGETAQGAYPVEAVAMMRKIAQFTEGSKLYQDAMNSMALNHGDDVADATVHAACTAAKEISARAIVAFTSSARTCFKVSFSRPKTQMIGATFTERAYNRLALCWGMTTLLMPEAGSVDELYFLAEKHLLQAHLVDPGDFIVLVTGSNIGAGGTNTIKIHKVGAFDIIADPTLKQRFDELYKELGIPSSR
jgi:pyruvate kinase